MYLQKINTRTSHDKHFEKLKNPSHTTVIYLYLNTMTETIIAITVGVVAGAVVMKVADIGGFIMSCISDTIIESNPRIVSKIDCFLASYGKCSSHTFDMKKPADGRHLFGNAFFYRESSAMGNTTSVTYTIHTWSRMTTQKLYRQIMQIEQSNNSIVVNSISSKSAWEHSIEETSKTIPMYMFRRQSEIIDGLISFYEKNIT